MLWKSARLDHEVRFGRRARCIRGEYKTEKFMALLITLRMITSRFIYQLSFVQLYCITQYHSVSHHTSLPCSMYTIF